MQSSKNEILIEKNEILTEKFSDEKKEAIYKLNNFHIVESKKQSKNKQNNLR